MKHRNAIKPTILLKLCLTCLAACIGPLLQTSFAQLTYRGGERSLLNLEVVDARVQNGITLRKWDDNQTLDGWWARAGDQPAQGFNLTHGSNPAPGLQIFVNRDTHRPLALGSLVNSEIPNTLLVVGIENKSGHVIKQLRVRIHQIQWYGGTGAMHDQRVAWLGLGGQNGVAKEWRRAAALDLKNFVADRGMLPEPIEVMRESVVTELDWSPDETLWLRWVDLKTDGGNAGAGIAEISIEAL